MKTSSILVNWKTTATLLAATLALAFNARAGFAPYPFNDSFESGVNTNYWTIKGTWGPTWETAHNGSSSLTDSPWAVFPPNGDDSATLNVDLRFGTTRPVLRFWHRYAFQSGQDYGFVEVSSNQGASWDRLAVFTGVSDSNWGQTKIDLTSYAGAQVQVRFRIKSDGQYQYDGWYIDDVAVSEMTGPAVYPFSDNMNTASSQSNWLSSIWQQMPGSPANGLGMTWRCQFGNTSYQPGGDLSACLTLMNPIDLSAAVHPKLSFWWRASVQYGNILYAQVSTDAGKTWNTIWSWDSNSMNSAPWTRTQIDLESYVGRANLALRFLAYNRPPGYWFNMDFQIDDVLVDEAPNDVTLTLAPGTDARHNALLTWTASTATDFSAYLIYRSTSPNVGTGSQLITTISNRSTTSFLDIGLDTIAQTYYYRVMVWDAQGLHNWGTKDVSYQTKFGQMAATLPFTDGFEKGDAFWALDRPWGTTTTMARGGSTNCLSSNPGSNYANNADVSAYLSVDLALANRPMLSFWQRYGFEPDQDYGFVEVSLNQGANWSRLYAVTSQSGTNWTKVQMPLDGYAGSQVLIRFRLRSDPQNQYDGWFIDDVEVKDFGAVAMGYPFFDSMDSSGSQSNWLATAWQQVPNGASTNGSDMSWRCQIGNTAYQPGGDLSAVLTLAGTVDLSKAVNPKLWFDWRASVQYGNILYAQVSTDAGKNWTTIWSWDSNSMRSSPWAQVQVDLNSYIGFTSLSLRFLAYNRPPGYWFNLDFQVDDVRISDQLAPATEVGASVQQGSDPRHNALLTWQPSSASAFSAYAVYRSTSPNVNINSLLITTITNQNTTTFQDVGLDTIGQTYYYRVIVWDTNGLHNTGVSDLTYQTRYGQMVTNLPFADGLEKGDTYWAADRPWGITTIMAHGGTNCLSSYPGTNYANNADVSAYLNVDLTKANRPMLGFWQRYAFESNQDYGFVEVSLNQGANWSRLYAVTSQSGTNWTKVQMPLDGYAGSQVLIRFRLKSDTGVQYDGWFIDDVEVKDFGAVALSYPFRDTMDTAASQTNWLGSAWQPAPNTGQTNGATLSWLCQIGNTAYQPGGDLSSVLALNGTLDLSAAVHPKLSFWWRAGVQYGNILYAQVSTDTGKNWTTIWSWDSNSMRSSPWTRAQIDLDAYVGRANITLRFLAYNRPPGYWFNMDFQVDDVLLDETPNDTTLTVGPGTDARHNALLTWTATTASDFASYGIYRSTSPNVGPDSLLLTMITNKATTSFLDTGLDLIAQTYYYRIIIWDTQGLHNWGAKDMPYQTKFGQMVTTLPFANGLESGDAYWALDRPWGISTTMAHNGINCLSSNPGTNYVNSADVSAYLSVDLATANRPMLSFWQRYAFEPNQDYGFVEVSLNQGANWSRLYAVTSQSGAAWNKVQVPLDGYAGTQVLIRFRLRSDGQNPYDGWFIDDVEVKDFGAVAMGYPFYDSVDSPASQSNWLTTAWQQVPGSGDSGAGMSWRSQIGNTAYQPGGDLSAVLTLAGTVDLSKAVNPKLWFNWRASVQYGNILYAQVSTDAGKNWTTIWSWDSNSMRTSPWAREQVDLNAYRGYSSLAFRFLAYNRPPGYWFNLDFQVDQVLIAEGGGVPAILTDNPLPVATLGYAYHFFLQATNGSTPYTWSVAANSLPPGLALDPVSGAISGVPTRAGTFNFSFGVTSSNNLNAVRQYVQVVKDDMPFFPTQTAQAFVSPGTNVVYCTVDNETGRRLLSLTWIPTLPAGWSVIGVQGDGNPELGLDGHILFRNQYLTNNPLQFSYRVKVPAGETQARQIGGSVTFLLDGGMTVDKTMDAFPNPLLSIPRIYHSSDVNTNWVIETEEASRVLAYWRFGGYQLDSSSPDGYSPGIGNQVGPLQSADFQTPAWYINGTEVDRVLAYWRGGAYKPDTNGVDGYSAGRAAALAKMGMGPVPVVTQQLPSTYMPGSSFLVTNTMEYSGNLLSLLWRPHLPAGWAVTNFFADGAPEMIGGELVWTAFKMPPSPIKVVYFVQVPPGEQGPKQFRDEVEYQMSGMANPGSVFASPDPGIINPATTQATTYATFVILTSVQRLPDGTVKLGLAGNTMANVSIMTASDFASPDWTTLTTLPGINGSMEYIDTTATSENVRFYRLISQ